MTCKNCESFHKTGVDIDPVTFVCRCLCHCDEKKPEPIEYDNGFS